jgi:uncharacterized membrane protein
MAHSTLINMEERMAEAEQKPNPRTGLLIWMIVSQLLTLGSLFIWLLMAGLSFMAFDAGVTQEAWIFVIAVWAYPLFPILMVIAAWIAYARRKNRLAAVLSGISFVPPYLLILASWLASMAWFLQDSLK